MTAQADVQELAGAAATAIQLGSELLELMEHAVGKNGYRNYYAEDPTQSQNWELLVGLRLAVRGCPIPGELRYYHVSVPGVAMLRALHPRRYKSELKGAPLPKEEP